MLIFFKKELAFVRKNYLLCVPFLILFTFFNSVSAEDLILERCEFVNNTNISDVKLKKGLGLKVGAVLDETKLAELESELLKFYKSFGFLLVVVNLNTVVDEYSNVIINCTVEEGNRARVAGVKFAGNLKVGSRKLQRLIKTKKYGLFRNAFYSEGLIEKDIERIKKYYQDENLGDCQILDVFKTIYKNGSEVELNYKILEAGSSVGYLEGGLDDSEDVSSSDVYNDYSAFDVEKMKLEMVRLSQLVNEKKDVVDLLSGMLVEEKVKRRSLAGEIHSAKERVLLLENDLEDEQVEKVELRNEIKTLRSERSQFSDGQKMASLQLHKINRLVNSKLKEIEKIKDALSDVVDETRDAISRELDRVELSQISISRGNADVAVPVRSVEASKEEEFKSEYKEGKPDSNIVEARKGKVLVLNPDLNFLVISLGVNKKVHQGMRFEILGSNAELKGECKVIEVRKGVSAADIVKKVADIKVGDIVIEKLN